MRFLVEVMPSTFGMEAGAAKSAFDPDSNTLKVFVDLQRMADRQQLATLVGCEVTSHLRTDWLDDSNIALLRATGKLDAVESVKGVPLTDPLLRSAIIPDVVIQDNRIGTPIEAQVNAHLQAVADRLKAAGEAFAAPLQSREYSVMVRRPCYAFATVHVEASSAEEALRLGMDKAEDGHPFPEYDYDDLARIDWAHAEWSEIGQGEHEHADWELPKPSAGVLMKALHDIRVLCEAMSYQPGSALLEIDAVAHKAIEASVPDYSEPHTYDDERK